MHTSCWHFAFSNAWELEELRHWIGQFVFLSGQKVPKTVSQIITFAARVIIDYWLLTTVCHCMSLRDLCRTHHSRSSPKDQTSTAGSVEKKRCKACKYLMECNLCFCYFLFSLILSLIIFHMHIPTQFSNTHISLNNYFWISNASLKMHFTTSLYCGVINRWVLRGCWNW